MIVNFLKNLQNIDSYVCQDPKFYARPFKQKDSEYIVEQLTKFPKESIYNVLTNKIQEVYDTDKSL
jgi:hypothetical protein